MPPHFLSHPCHEVEVCRGQGVSEAKVILVPFFDNRPDIILRDICFDRFVNIGILPSVNFTQQKRTAKQRTIVWSSIIRLMNNQTKKPKKGHSSVVIVKIVPQLGCVSQDSELFFSRRGNSLGKNRCKKSWDRFEKYGSHSLRYVKQVSGERKFRSHEETLGCARRLGTVTTTIASSKRKKKLHVIRPRKMSTPLCVNRRVGRKEFVIDHRAGMHMVSERDLNFAELETMRISRNLTKVMTAKGERQTREEAPENVKDMGLLDGYAS